jgi:hypothetical protein
MTYIVETRMGNTWENCWTEDGNVLVTFDTLEAAQTGISELLAQMPDYIAEDYRIVQA